MSARETCKRFLKQELKLCFAFEGIKSVNVEILDRQEYETTVYRAVVVVNYPFTALTRAIECVEKNVNVTGTYAMKVSNDPIACVPQTRKYWVTIHTTLKRK
jgi:hypothetical protein